MSTGEKDISESLNAPLQSLTLSREKSYLQIYEHNEDGKKTQVIIFSVDWWSDTNWIKFNKILSVPVKADDIMLSIKSEMRAGDMYDNFLLLGINCITTEDSKCNLTVLAQFEKPSWKAHTEIGNYYFLIRNRKQTDFASRILSLQNQTFEFADHKGSQVGGMAQGEN